MFTHMLTPNKLLRKSISNLLAALLLTMAILLQPSMVNAQDSTRSAKKVIEGKHIKIQIYENEGNGDSIIREYDIQTPEFEMGNESIEIEKNIELMEELNEETIEGIEEQIEEMTERLEEQLEVMEEQLEEQHEAMEDAHEEMEMRIEIEMDEGDVDRAHDGKSIRIIHGINDDHHEKTRIKTVEQSWFVMDLGWNAWITDNTFDLPESFKEMELDRGASVNFHLGIIQQGVNLYKGRVRFVYGIGIEFNNYRFKKDVDLISDLKPLAYTVNADRNYKKNKLVSNYATIPLMINIKTKNDADDEAFKLAAGIQLGYLIGSHTKQKWGENGKKQKSKIKGDYSFEDYRIGYVVQFGYGDFNIFGKYYPTEVFKSGQGPVANTASVGLVLTPF
jgi:Outer membrane protein beta-barrel domain